MNCKLLVIAFCLLFLNGCSSSTVSNLTQKNESSLTPPVGQVNPIPEGCLSIEFFSSTDTSRYIHDDSGHISIVITPLNRTESLKEQWTQQEFEELVYGNNGNDQLTHYIPGIAAWEYLKKYLQPGDEIWSFGILDSGFVILREGKLFAMVVTEHSL